MNRHIEGMYRSVPFRSNFSPRASAHSPGIAAWVAMAASTPMIAGTTNRERQPAQEMSTPPITGDRASPVYTAVTEYPMARPRSR
jgi:hypothetical protein